MLPLTGFAYTSDDVPRARVTSYHYSNFKYQIPWSDSHIGHGIPSAHSFSSGMFENQPVLLWKNVSLDNNGLQTVTT